MNKQLSTLLIGRIITNIADSLYMIATIWFVKNTTNSELLVGLTTAIAMLPMTLQFLYGPIIDRFSKRKILFLSEIGQGIIITIISILYFTNLLWIPLLIILLLLAISLSEVTYPTEIALIERLTPKDKLTKVNSIFAFSFQTLDIISDALSGILIVFVGVGFVYLSNSILLILTGLLFLFYLKIPKSKKETEKSSLSFMQQYKEDFVTGFKVVKQQKILLNIMFGIVGINLLATMGISMLPIISSNSAEYGFWLTAMSTGTLIGTVISSWLERIPLKLVMPITSLTSGLFWILSVTTRETHFLNYIFFGFAWIGIGVLSIFIQSLIQVNLPEEYMGSGFAFFTSILGSLSPLGSFVGGLIGEFNSGSFVMYTAATGYICFSIYFILHPKLRNLDNTLNEKLN